MDMLNVLELEESSEWFLEDEWLLHQDLLKQFPPIKINNVEVTSEIHINSTVREIEKYFSCIEKLEKELEERKLVAPVWKTALEQGIAKLEKMYLNCGQTLIFEIYSDITMGNDRFIYQYASLLIEDRENKKNELIDELEKVGFAVALAYLLPKLKQELKRLQEHGIDTSLQVPMIEHSNEKDKLTTKQQVHLLHSLGIFDLPQIANLTEQKRGILFGYLLNRNEKNTEDTIRNRFAPLPDKVTKPVFDLLKELGLEKFEKL